MELCSWVYGWVGFWGDVSDVDLGGIRGVVYRRAAVPCMGLREVGNM